MSETLQMIFSTAEGRNTTISVADPDSEIGLVDVEPVMDSIIARNIFETNSGEITAKVRAQVVSRTVDMIGEF